MAYRLTDPARADMRNILLYTLHQWGDAQASRYETTLVAAFERIGDNPVALPSKSCAELLPGGRSLAVGKHIVLYRRTGETTEILRILHQRMHLPLHQFT